MFLFYFIFNQVYVTMLKRIVDYLFYVIIINPSIFNLHSELHEIRHFTL